jgi:serine/threonine protein phosphatase PrpC
MSLKKRVADFLSGGLQMAPAKRVSVASPASSDDESDRSTFDAAGLLATATSAGAPPLPGPGEPASLAAPPQHSSHADQGGRPYMEDAHAHAQVAPGAAAFAVFDGHGGAHVADLCADRLLPHVAAGLAAGPATSAAAARRRSASAGGAAGAAAAAGMGAPDGPAVAAALRGAFDAVDRELQGDREAHMCGTTAAVCVVTQDWVYTANCGARASGGVGPWPGARDRGGGRLSGARSVAPLPARGTRGNLREGGPRRAPHAPRHALQPRRRQPRRAGAPQPRACADRGPRADAARRAGEPLTRAPACDYGARMQAAPSARLPLSRAAAVPDRGPLFRHPQERIKRAGGKVVWSNGLRVMGALSMTRAIGDHFLRRHGVIPDPEITATARTAADEFLILATDGLWNFVSTEEAAAVARRALARASALPRATAALVVPRALTKLALARGGSDNVTVTYVDLRRQPAPARPAAAAAAAAAPAPAPAAAPVHSPAPIAAEAPAPAGAAQPSALAAAAEAAPAGGTPFQAPGLQLPALHLRPIRTRNSDEAGALLPAVAARAASDPAMQRCSSAGLPWEADGGASPLAMLRAKSAPVRLHHHTVTTGGPLPPGRAPAAAGGHAPPRPLSALGACACGGAAAAAAASDGAALACRRSAGGHACAASCYLRSLALSSSAASLAAAGGAAGTAAIAVGGAGAWLRSMECDQ